MSELGVSGSQMMSTSITREGQAPAKQAGNKSIMLGGRKEFLAAD
jgi:hypothetical protein